MINRGECEFLRVQAKQRFDKVRSTWIDCGRWAAPHRIRWMLSQVEGERNNQHIVDATHILALRSYVAGFLEGNTSVTRPWYRIGTNDPELNMRPENHQWLDRFTRRTLQVLSTSNFYHAAGEFYYDYGVFNTGAHYIEERQGRLHFHTLVPGSYFLLNNGYGEAVMMIREFSLTVKALVETYGKKVDGSFDWSNLSSSVRKMYDDGLYTQCVDVVHVIKQNDSFEPDKPQVLLNRPWIQYTYEVGGNSNYAYMDGQESGFGEPSPKDREKFLKVEASKRKPFIAGRSFGSANFEYGEKGPTTDSLGIIKSLNKKALGKDQALEQMLRPPLQGPASLKKSYVTTASNSYIPLDPNSLAQKGLRPIFEVNPGLGALIQDVSDLRQMVEKLYYSDYLLYLSSNPKTRTARETDAVVAEQKIVIGPNLQSLNWTYNVPVVEFVMDYVLFEDPYMEQYPPPQGLLGNFLQPQFISVFAQAQNAADLPQVERYMAMIASVGQINSSIFQKANLDKLADIYEDRLFLPSGLNNPQSKVDAMREQAQAQMERQRMLEQTLPAVAGAAKDVGLKINQGEQ